MMGRHPRPNKSFSSSIHVETSLCLFFLLCSCLYPSSGLSNSIGRIFHWMKPDTTWKYCSKMLCSFSENCGCSMIKIRTNISNSMMRWWATQASWVTALFPSRFISGSKDQISVRIKRHVGSSAKINWLGLRCLAAIRCCSYRYQNLLISQWQTSL